MTKKRMIHSAAAAAVIMVVFMVMLVCAPRVAMAVDAYGSASGSGWWYGSGGEYVITSVSNGGKADSLTNGSVNVTATTAGTGTVAITGANVSITGATGITGTTGITGATTVTGTLTSSGNSTIGTGAAANNTFGAGANSTNQIGNAGTSTNTITGTTNAITAATTNTITAATTNINTSGTLTATSGTNAINATTGDNTINAVAGANFITGNTNNTMTATTGTNTINAAAANNAINAATTNDITGGTGNTLTATTGTNIISAVGAGGENIVNGTTTINGLGNNYNTTINAGTSTGFVNIGNSANTTSLNSATNNIGVTSLVGAATTNNIGTTAAFATSNNIGTGANISTNAIGNINAGTTVVATGGNGVLSVANTQSSLTAGAVLGTNGTSGTTSGSGSGGLTVYNTAQTVGPNTTIQTALLPTGILDGKKYQNEINGNLLVDGNVYINGTLDYVSSNSANTTVVGGAGTSTLNSAQGTTAGTAIVMKGSAGIQTVVDGHGNLTNIVTPGAAQSTAALTLTNGDGNTHGIVVAETQTTVSGGRFSTAMTLHDDGATFSNTTNGEPVRVHGIADGTAPHDAVNVQQLGAGLAMVSSLAALPQVEPGKRFAIGVGTGGYMSQVALAGGLSARFRENFVFKAGAAFVPGYDGNTRPVWNAGIQYSF